MVGSQPFAATSGAYTGLTNGESYTFTVVAHNAVGAGPASAPSNSVVPVGPPGPPTGVTATPGDGWATVDWTAPAQRGGDDAFLGYRVTASPGGATRYVLHPTTTATVTGLAPGTAYTFTVTATNGYGTSEPSAPSTPVTVTGGAAPPPGGPPGPGAPSNLVVTTAHRQATVSWTDTDPAAISYTVTARGAFSSAPTRTATVAAPASSATVTGLTDGDSYFFMVAATNAAGGQTSSVASDLTTLPALLVGLGDSYASGQGDPPYEPGTGDPQDGCRRSIYRGDGAVKGEVGLAPFIAAPALTARNIACSGAKTSKVLSDSFKGEPPQVQQLTGDERYLALSVGGDDLEPGGLHDLIDACVNVLVFHLRPPCKPVLESESPSLTTKINNLRPTLASTYRRLLAAAPFADLYVFGYPKIFEDAATDDCDFVRKDDTQYLNEKVVQLDGVISGAVDDANAGLGTQRVFYLDTLIPFAGHDLCAGDSSYFNMLTIGRNATKPYVESENSLDTPFHPNDAGWNVLARILGEKIRDARPGL